MIEIQEHQQGIALGHWHPALRQYSSPLQAMAVGYCAAIGAIFSG